LCSEQNWLFVHDIPIDGQEPNDAGKVQLKIAIESCNYNNFVPRSIPSCFTGKDDELVAAGVPDGQIYIWSLPDGRGKRIIDHPLLVLRGHDQRILSLRFSQQNCALASCGADGKQHESFKVWTPFKLPQPVCDDDIFEVGSAFDTEDDDGGSNSSSYESIDSSDQSEYYYSSSSEEDE
jgi:WD40 repeat protein